MRLLEALNVILMTVLSTVLVGYFPFRNQYKLRPRHLALLTAGIFTVDTVIGAIEVAFPLRSFGRLLLFFAALLLSAAAAFLIMRKSFFLHLFIVSIFKSYIDNIRMGSAAIASSFFPADLPRRLLLELVIFSLTLPLLSIPVRRYFHSILSFALDKPFWRYLCIIPLGLFLIDRAALSPDYLYPGAAWPSAPLWLSLFWPTAVFLAYFVVLREYCIAAENALLRRKIRNAGLVLTVKTEQNSRMKQSADCTYLEQLRMSSQLRELQKRLQEGDQRGAREKIKDFLGRLDQISTKRLCANIAVDGVAKRYLQWAENANIRMELHLDLPETLPISETDFFLVLGNLLENALEACNRKKEGERFILVNAGIAGRYGLMLSVRNSYGDEPTARDGVYLSSKRSGGPGIGLASIRAVAAKYGGVTRFSHANGIFEASALLYAPLPGQEGGPLCVQ